MIKVKICGVQTKEVLEAALASGADYIGFMFYPQSKRFISLDQAASLRKLIKLPTQTVAVVVDGDDALLSEIVTRIKPDFIQAHGKESPARIAEIKQKFSVPLIKAIGVETAADIDKALAYEAADKILFDNKQGGSGESFNWHLLGESRSLPQNWFLAGGLNQANLAQAVQESGAGFVDVSSGVEDNIDSDGGNKTPARVQEFLMKAKTL